jgi:putative FmdB family regulatory protein
MPRYDMQCTKCAHREEDIILTYENMKVYKCPECGSATEYVPGEVVINTSASTTFVRVPPERKAEIAFMREQHKQKRAEEKEKRNARRAQRGGA